jgi:hypothetical protein
VIAIDIDASQIDADVIDIAADAVTTAKVIDITADLLTTGSALYIDDNSPSTGTRSDVSILQNNPLAIAATALTLQSDGGVTGMFLDKNFSNVAAATVRGLHVDFDRTVPGSGTATFTDIGIDLDVNAAGLGTTTTTGLDIDVVGAASGTHTVVGLDVNVSGSNDLPMYAAKFVGGDILVGVNDTGHDVTFYGDAAGAAMIWDTSADSLLVRGATADAAGSSGRIVLQTAQISVEDGDILGRLDFQAPLETQGSDGALVSASIWAEADATFTASVNNTELVFATNTGDAAAEKMRLDSGGQLGIGTATPAYLLDVQGTVGITGASTMIGALTVGVDGTGHDVKFFGDTASAYMEWDQSADELEIRGPVATPGKLLLSTAETSVVDGNKLGQIDFQAPLDSAGTDAILVGASIHAEADATFSSSVNATELVFSVGASEAATEQMRIASDGKVGLATSQPASQLHVNGTMQVGVDDTGYLCQFFADTAGGYMKWNPAAEGSLRFADSSLIYMGTGSDMTIYHDGSNAYIRNTAGALKLATETSGIAVTIGHTTSVVTIGDNLTVTDTITESSMREMKDNIEPIENILPAVMQLQGVSFDWKKDKDNDKRLNHYGFIAEDVNKVLPNLVSYSEEGKPTGVQYSKMTAVLLEAIKEQQVQIDELKSKLN